MSDDESDDDSFTLDNLDCTEDVREFTNEDNVNRRAGHVAVSHQGRVIVWGGYMENQTDSSGDYWPTTEVWIYCSLTGLWRHQKTSGPAPTKCSGAAACVLDDNMYVVAGFHKVMVDKKMYQDPEFDPPSDDNGESDTETDDLIPAVQISNSLWRLDLLTWVWTKLEPEGERPLRCDKTACWSHNDRIYLFGGFGPPLTAASMDVLLKFSFEVDPSTVGMYPRGWSNQLVYYHTRNNKWEWPATTGTTPLPRAAHAVAVVGDMAYVFGGRHQDHRLNDLHRLDLTTLTWTNLLPATNSPPVGRSWQVLVPVDTGSPEGGLLMYGGFGNEEVTLSDCWKIDFKLRLLSWQRCKHWEEGPRLWHAAAASSPGQILIIGGLTNNILAPASVLKHHAEKVIHISTSPPSLLKICLEYVTKKQNILSSQFEDLPVNLKRIVEIRCSSASGA